MTLLIAVPTAVVLGWFFGQRRWVGVVAGLVWYACLASQTAYLAHPGRTGFFGLDALAAIQGSGFGQYWIAQAVIVGLLAGGLLGADRLHRRQLMRSARRRVGAPHAQGVRPSPTSTTHVRSADPRGSGGVPAV